jgi:hypothetical protein
MADGVVIWMKYECVFQSREDGGRGRVDAGRGREEVGRKGVEG